MMFIGNIIAFSGHSIPEGYLECDGSAISRDEYNELFTVIGTSYGAGDGSTTFNLPNLNGRVALGASQGYSVGANGGEEAHSLASLELPSHIHLIPEHTHGNSIDAETPSLSHTITQPSATYTRLGNNTQRGFWTPATAARYNGLSNATMSRTTDLAIADHPATPCTVTGGILDCPTFNTESTGGGVAHNNMMPYLSIRYIIRCVAPAPSEKGMAFFNGFMVATAGGGYISGKTV